MNSKKINTAKIPILDSDDLRQELTDNTGMPLNIISYHAHNYFHINRIEDYFKVVDAPPPSELMPRRLKVFSFFFLKQGTSIKSNGIDTYEFGENSFFFTPAHQITTGHFVRTSVSGYYCHFNLDLISQKTNLQELIKEFPFFELNSYPLVNVSNETRENIIIILERLCREYHADKNCRNDILRTYLMALFSELKPFIEASKPKNQNAASLITEEFKKALSVHILSKNKITDYAELLNVSPNHLNKCVKNTVGKSAHDLLNEMLLLEAKVLLKQTNLNITEIAFKIGKSEISDFTRFFKAQTGISPSEYRLSK
ncbi:MAG: helix-turn-helix transcriptional regulator [Arcicella sp.]|nr:helix-turn-helix transcriptional regulator [Arcicella sp.]